MRIGFVLSYTSSRIAGQNGGFVEVHEQLRSARLLAHPGIQLVGVIEPGTGSRGPVEEGLREHQLTAGLIDARDEAGLRTLDVIVLGVDLHLTVDVARALAGAVRNGGVGLLNEWWVSAYHEEGRNDPSVRDLMLADSPTFSFHTPVCGDLLPAVVRDEHPEVFPGLKPGMTFLVTGCGPAYRVKPGCRVVAEKDRVVTPTEHRLDGLGDVRMPVCVTGGLGKGRVAVVNTWSQTTIPGAGGVAMEDYLYGMIAWLARPRRGS